MIENYNFCLTLELIQKFCNKRNAVCVMLVKSPIGYSVIYFSNVIIQVEFICVKIKVIMYKISSIAVV